MNGTQDVLGIPGRSIGPRPQLGISCHVLAYVLLSVSISMLHAALRAEIAQLFEFVADGSLWMSCLGVSCVWSLQRPRAAAVEPPRVRQPVPLSLCPCSFPRLLSDMPHAYWVPAAGKRQSLPITGTYSMRVIRHTISPPLLFRHGKPHLHLTTWGICTRQTIRQHGDCSCIVETRWRQRDLRHRSEMKPDLPAWCPWA